MDKIHVRNDNCVTPCLRICCSTPPSAHLLMYPGSSFRYRLPTHRSGSRIYMRCSSLDPDPFCPLTGPERDPPLLLTTVHRNESRDLLHHEGVTQLPSPAQGHVDPKYAAILHHVTAVLIIVTGGGGTGKGIWVWGGRGQCSDSVPAIRRRSPVWCLLCNSAVSIIIPGDGRWASPSSER